MTLPKWGRKVLLLAIISVPRASIGAWRSLADADRQGAGQRENM